MRAWLGMIRYGRRCAARSWLQAFLWSNAQDTGGDRHRRGTQHGLDVWKPTRVLTRWSGCLLRLSRWSTWVAGCRSPVARYRSPVRRLSCYRKG